MRGMWIQWPSGTLKHNVKRLLWDLLTTRNRARTSHIEDYFNQLTGYEVILFSSARNALFALVEELEFTRKSKVYLPPFSALCLYECFGRKIDISTDLIAPDITLVNHKWGTIHQTKSKSDSSILIEDSCDALISSGENMFPNGGRIQIISLPKIMGTVSGGLVFFKESDDPLLDKIKNRQRKSTASQKLFWKKLIYYKTNMKRQKNWEQIEFESRGVNWLDSLEIMNVIPDYQNNLLKLQYRLEMVCKVLGKMNRSTNYLGPVAILNGIKSDYDQLAYDEQSIIKKYHLDTKFRNGESNPLEEVLIFPIHLGIREEIFQSNLNQLANAVSQGANFTLLN